MASYEPGEYMCDILEQGFTESKNKGTLGFYLKFVPVGRIQTHGDYENLADPGGNYERMVTLWITDNTAERRIEDLRRLGFDGSSFRELDPTTNGHFSFKGARLRFECKHEAGQGEYAGKTFDRWDVPYFGGGGGPEVPQSKTAAAKLDNLYGKVLKQTAATKKPAAKPAPAKQTVPQDFDGEPGGEDDSIPF